MDQAMQRETVRTPNVVTPRIGGRQLATLAVVIVTAVVVALALVPVSSDTRDATASIQAETARWEALAAAEYPGAAAGATAEAARWTALASAYQANVILSPGRQAEMARWEALAERHLRAQHAEAARWSGLAAHHIALTPANQAWADRYQGLADK